MSLSETTGLSFPFPFLCNFIVLEVQGAGEWRGLTVSGRDAGIIKDAKVSLFSSPVPLLWKEANQVQRCFSSQWGNIPVPLPKGDFWEHQEPCCCRALEWQEGSGLDPAGRCVFLCAHRPAPVLSRIRAALWKWRIAEPVVLCQDRGILS